VREIGSVLRARRAARVVGDESMTPQPPGDTPPRGRVVAVWGPAGAPGRTTVAVSLADEWVRRGQRVLVVDADTWAPSLGVVVGLADEGPGLAAACRRALAGMLDPDALAPLLREVRPGLRVLPGLPRAGRWTEARAVAVAEVVSVAQRMADVVVLDIAAPLERDEELQFDTDAPGRNAATLTALDLADVVVVVGSCEPPALVRLVTGLDDLREVIGETPVRVVVTRVRESVAGRRPAAAVAEALHRHAGLDALWCVADDRPALDAALRSGRTLAEAAPSSPARTALRSLAVELGDDLGLGSPAARQRTTSTSRRGDGVLHGGGAASRAAR
jgi:MinD-like ATPase involved in chromosome partitioning or flagellar assembly